MTLQQLTQLLRRHGIEPDETLGRPFDPHYHEAVSVRHDPSQPDQVILETFQRGYRRGSEVFRSAKVVSSKAARPDEVMPNIRGSRISAPGHAQFRMQRNRLRMFRDEAIMLCLCTRRAFAILRYLRSNAFLVADKWLF